MKSPSTIESRMFTCDYPRRRSEHRDSPLTATDVLYDPALCQEALLALLLIGCGVFLLFFGPISNGPVARLAYENIPQSLIASVLLVIGVFRLYGVFWQKSRIRIIAGMAAATVWCSFFLMTLGAEPPVLGVVIYFWLAMNSLVAVFRIKE